MAKEITVTFEDGGVFEGFANTYTLGDEVTYYFSFDRDYRVQLIDNAISLQEYRNAGAWYPIDIIVNFAVSEISGGGSGDYITKEEADNLYAPKGTYLTKADADMYYQSKGNYATENWCYEQFYTKGYCDSNFAGRLDLANNYLTKNDTYDTFVKKVGDTMTGPLTFDISGAKGTISAAGLQFITDTAQVYFDIEGYRFNNTDKNISWSINENGLKINLANIETSVSLTAIEHSIYFAKHGLTLEVTGNNAYWWFKDDVWVFDGTTQGSIWLGHAGIANREADKNSEVGIVFGTPGDGTCIFDNRITYGYDTSMQNYHGFAFPENVYIKNELKFGEYSGRWDSDEYPGFTIHPNVKEDTYGYPLISYGDESSATKYPSYYLPVGSAVHKTILSRSKLICLKGDFDVGADYVLRMLSGTNLVIKANNYWSMYSVRSTFYDSDAEYLHNNLNNIKDVVNNTTRLTALANQEENLLSVASNHNEVSALSKSMQITATGGYSLNGGSETGITTINGMEMHNTNLQGSTYAADLTVAVNPAAQTHRDQMDFLCNAIKLCGKGLDALGYEGADEILGLGADIIEWYYDNQGGYLLPTTAHIDSLNVTFDDGE